MPDKLLTVRQAAAELNTSIWTIYRLVRLGDLVAFRVGKRLKIPQSSVDVYLELRRVKPG
ncbi:MAG: helix-turn-helix domain-containing protein [Nitrososphaerota archaeon]